MQTTNIQKEIRNLSPVERLEVIEYMFSLLKEDFSFQKETTKEKQPLTSIAQRIEAAGKEALQNGAPLPPTDLASHHNFYLYGNK